jgi:hypothetical protein
MYAIGVRASLKRLLVTNQCRSLWTVLHWLDFYAAPRFSEAVNGTSRSRPENETPPHPPKEMRYGRT